MASDAREFVQEAEMIRSEVAIMALARERGIQRLEFPPEADDALLPAEWLARITKHTGRAVTMDPAEYRKELVVIGALSLAAIESYDRKYRERS